jgi:catechol 2,3-dioxygenase-like lactoylglutathione lyase family enzyme
MVQACSHIVIATKDVPRQTEFFSLAFSIKPHFHNGEFAEFILPSRFRIAFFKPTGLASRYFSSKGERKTIGIGITVDNVDTLYDHIVREKMTVSGVPKDHPWGERSFLLIDPDGNRWEVVQSPSADGLLLDISSKVK